MCLCRPSAEIIWFEAIDEDLVGIVVVKSLDDRRRADGDGDGNFYGVGDAIGYQKEEVSYDQGGSNEVNVFGHLG